jgi:hypothetical protein
MKIYKKTFKNPFKKINKQKPENFNPNTQNKILEQKNMILQSIRNTFICSKVSVQQQNTTKL